MLLEGKLGKELACILQEHYRHYSPPLMIAKYGDQEIWLECQRCGENLLGAKLPKKQAKKEGKKNGA